MPIDNYEQYKRVINQITGRSYMHIYISNNFKTISWFLIYILVSNIYILETKNLFFFFFFFFAVCVVIYNNLLLIHL